LVKFVEHYIQDDYTANPLTLMNVIEKKKGDCSEHAKLFTALARALGIPCRTVGGLVYLGDAYQAFGLHAWNEVVMGGVWVPVDPTWGQTAIDTTHIRFPVEISKEWQVMAVIPEMKMEVLHVEHRK
jgi:transglutaminase-like putative cysteine protease